jgi:hypothetical protein
MINCRDCGKPLGDWAPTCPHCGRPEGNDRFFNEPHWRVIAGGFQPEAWFESDLGRGTGGIFNPQPIKLPAGHFYYRFASRTASQAAQRGGGWWLDFENFSRVRAFAGEHGYPLSDAARLLLALPYDWTRVDLLLRVALKVPLKAYAGFGKPALATSGRDAGTRWIPPSQVRVQQLYIPGLYVHRTRRRAPQLYEHAFDWPGEVTRP